MVPYRPYVVVDDAWLKLEMINKTAQFKYNWLSFNRTSRLDENIHVSIRFNMIKWSAMLVPKQYWCFRLLIIDGRDCIADQFLVD